jgi:hypothetical protein
MKYHKYDPQTLLYVETIESEQQPENSISGELPEITEFYTVAFINDEWISVLKSEYEIIDNQIVKKESEDGNGTES